MMFLQFQYRPVFSVSLKNNYFEDNRMRNFTIKPTVKTSKLITNLGFLFKQTPDGFFVLGDNIDSEKLAQKLEKAKNSNFKLQFALFMKDPIFKNYTDYPYDTSDEMLFLSNKHLGSSKKGNLAKSEFVSSSDLSKIEDTEIPLKEKGLLLGIIELELNDQIVDDLVLNLIDNELVGYEYEAVFSSRSVVWKYLVVPTYSKKLKNLAIASDSNSENIKFLPPKEVTTKENVEVLVFESEEPLKYQEFYDFSFQLKRGDVGNGGKTLIKKLQYPPIDMIKPILNKPDKYCSEIYVYI